MPVRVVESKDDRSTADLPPPLNAVPLPRMLVTERGVRLNDYTMPNLVAKMSVRFVCRSGLRTCRFLAQVLQAKLVRIAL